MMRAAGLKTLATSRKATPQKPKSRSRSRGSETAKPKSAVSKVTSAEKEQLQVSGPKQQKEAVPRAKKLKPSSTITSASVPEEPITTVQPRKPVSTVTTAMIPQSSQLKGQGTTTAPVPEETVSPEVVQGTSVSSSPPLSATERAWASALDKSETERLVKGVLDGIIDTVVQIAERREAERMAARQEPTPDVDTAIVPRMEEVTEVEEEIFPVLSDVERGRERLEVLQPRSSTGYSPSQLSDSVKNWLDKGQMVDPLVVQGLKPPPDSRPPTPAFRSPRPGELFEPISPATPQQSPRYGGIPVEAENLAEMQEAAGVMFTDEVRIQGGAFVPSSTPEAQGVEPMDTGKRSRHSSRETVELEVGVEPAPSTSRQRHSSQETVKYTPPPTPGRPPPPPPIEPEVIVLEPEDTSAKESIGGSPEPRRRKRRLSASERQRESSLGRSGNRKTAETGSSTKRGKYVSTGKDIRSLQRTVAAEQGVPEAKLSTPKTYKSSLYGQTQREKKQEQAESRKEQRAPILFGGKGRGKGGRKQPTPKKRTGKAMITQKAAATRQGWQDPQVIRALAGGPPPGAIPGTSSQTDSDAVVPHSGRIKRKKVVAAAAGAPQQVPVNPVVQQAVVAARAANQARNQVNRAPRHRRRPGTKALMEIRDLQKTFHNLIPIAPLLRLIRELAADQGKGDYRWQSSAVMAIREAVEMYLIGYLHDSNLVAIHAKRVTIMPKDMQLVKRLRESDYGTRSWFK